tara:strand:- start:72 stop:482 length:411 start_codon:yes stop_codon:yes gene_type:complete
MGPWWLYTLVFIFGYVTCQTFYFLRSTRVSLKLMKSSRVIYLLMMAKAMEKYKIAEEVMLMNLKLSGRDQEVINSFKESIHEERQSFQQRSVSWIIDNTPATFRDIIGFDDWDSAMKFLVLHQEEAFKFWRINDDK